MKSASNRARANTEDVAVASGILATDIITGDDLFSPTQVQGGRALQFFAYWRDSAFEDALFVENPDSPYVYFRRAGDVVQKVELAPHEAAWLARSFEESKTPVGQTSGLFDPPGLGRVIMTVWRGANGTVRRLSPGA